MINSIVTLMPTAKYVTLVSIDVVKNALLFYVVSVVHLTRSDKTRHGWIKSQIVLIAKPTL